MHNYNHIIFVFFFLKENKVALSVSGLLRQVLTVQIGLEFPSLPGAGIICVYYHTWLTVCAAVVYIRQFRS